MFTLKAEDKIMEECMPGRYKLIKVNAAILTRMKETSTDKHSIMRKNMGKGYYPG